MTLSSAQAQATRNADGGADGGPDGGKTNGGWRIWLARRAHHLAWPFERLRRAADLLGEAIPIGLLDRPAIDAAVRRAYADVPGFYDPMRYRIRFELELIPLLERAGGGKRLLDLYCGHGREAELFAGAGYRVLGVDAQDDVIRRARDYADRAGFEAEFFAADVDHWAPDTKDWDVVYSSLWMYSTIPDRHQRLHWLKRVQQWVSPDGVLVISTTPMTSTRRARLRHAFARALALITVNRRRSEVGDRFRDYLFWRDFTQDEVEQELSSAGLRIVDRLEIAGGTPCHFFITKPQEPGA